MEAKWRATRPVAYQFTFKKRCMCPYSDVPVTVEVRAREVVAVDGAPPETSDPDKPRYTIEDLFALHQEYLKSGDYFADVMYEPRFGYPSNLRLKSKKGFDVDLTIEIIDFKAI
jgi:hypothetical protein